MIIEVRRAMVSPYTEEDIQIFKRMPSWLRTYYKVADRSAAEKMFAWADQHEDETQTLTTARLVRERQVLKLRGRRNDASERPLSILEVDDASV